MFQWHINRGAIRHIPPYLHQMVQARIMNEHGKRPIRLKTDAFVSTRVAVYTGRAKDIISFRVLYPQVTRGSEAVDKQGSSALAVRVREQMKHLEACGVGEISRVRVRSDAELSVSRILGGKV